MYGLRSDLRYACRGMLRRPGWTAAAVLTLGLGIGAVTAIFSIVNGVLLRPLPFAEPDRVSVVKVKSAEDGEEYGSVSYPVFGIARDHQGFVESLHAYSGYQMSVNLGTGAEILTVSYMSEGTTETLGVKPILGRSFQGGDDLEGGAPAALLSYPVWRDRFSEDPSVLGRLIEVSETAHTIVGVMPSNFRFPRSTISVWISMATAARAPSRHYLALVGRLRPELRLEEAQAQARATKLTVPRGTPGKMTEVVLDAVPLHEDLVGDVRPLLMLFLAAVSAVLLVACINVINLMLSRSASREREVALRAALGAGRLRLARQALVESLALGALGGFLGCALAFALTGSLIALMPGSIPMVDRLAVDGRALGFAAALSLGTGLAVGLFPALKVSRPRLGRRLQEGARGFSSGVRHNRLRKGLVIAQVALALALLVSSGLLFRSFLTLSLTPIGFHTENVWVAMPILPRSSYSEFARATDYYQTVAERVRALPNIEFAALVSTPPFSGIHANEAIHVVGYQPGPNEAPWVDQISVGPGYFAALGMTLLQGRVLDERDREDAAKTVVISRSLAERYFPGRDPLGESIRLGADERLAWYHVVGVVNDVRPYRLNREIQPTAYVSYRQSQDWKFGMSIVARSAGPAPLASAGLRHVVASVDPNVPIRYVALLNDLISNSVAVPRFRTVLLGAFGLAALLLSAIGVYGVMSYAVVQRTHEIGVRMALGADRARVMRTVAAGGVALTAAGTVLGLAGAYLMGGLLESQLYQLDAGDPLTYGGAVIVLAVVALAACYFPARRAGRLDPVEALRCE